MPEDPRRFFGVKSVPVHTYKFGHHRVKLSPSLAYWDNASSCAFLRADPDYFDDAIAWSASMRNAPSWRSFFAEDLGMAARAALHHGETVGLQPDPDERRCALFSPVTRPQNVRVRQQATRIAQDFAALSDHHTWVHNIRVTQFAYLSNPEANAEIIEGFVDAIRGVEQSHATVRWLVDVQRHALPCFGRILLSEGADAVEAETDTDAIGELIAAVRLGWRQQVQLQLDRGRSIDQMAGYNLYALMLAALRGHAEIVAQLLDHGADTARTNSIGRAVFTMAVQEGRLELLPPLLAAGADLHACTLRGEDALMFAAHAGHIEIIRFLLKHGADPGRRNRIGQSASDFARQRGAPHPGGLAE